MFSVHLAVIVQNGRSSFFIHPRYSSELNIGLASQEARNAEWDPKYLECEDQYKQ